MNKSVYHRRGHVSMQRDMITFVEGVGGFPLYNNDESNGTHTALPAETARRKKVMPNVLGNK